MRAIDTNILVRLVARDDPAQVARATQIVSEPFLLLPTIVLEAEWVLRARYALPRDRIADAFEAVAGLPTATVASAAALAWALTRWRQSGDFADLLHIALAAEAGATAFATFDQRITRDAPIPIEVLV